MSNQLGRSVSEILNRYFGEIIRTVGNDLFTFGNKPIGLIVKSTKLTRNQVIESLRSLIKYDLVSFEPSNNETIAEYKLNTENVLLLLRYPRYLLQIKTKFGSEAELLIEEILQHGTMTITSLLLNIARRYKNDKDKNINLVSLKDTFVSLSTAGYIQHAPVAEGKEQMDIPSLVKIVTVIPDIDIRSLLQAFNSGDDSTINDNIQWKVNFDRFHQDFRDEIMIKAMTRRIDENAGELMRQMLLQMYLGTDPWAPTSNPISAIDVKDCCRHTAAEYPLLLQHFDQYLKVLEENGAGFVRRTDDANGGHLLLQMRAIAELLVWQVLEFTVTERLGSKAARIFRLIRTKKYIEEEDIQKHAMLPNKECKELTYKLMEEHFISVQPMRKTASSGSQAKAVYLYHIDFHDVSNTVLDMCYRSLHNVTSRAAHETKQHGRLLDKQRRVRSIVHGMRIRGDSQNNIDDIEDTITPPERVLLQSVEKRLKQLSTAELELDKTLFILQWHFSYKLH